MTFEFKLHDYLVKKSYAQTIIKYSEENRLSLVTYSPGYDIKIIDDLIFMILHCSGHLYSL